MFLTYFFAVLIMETLIVLVDVKQSLYVYLNKTGNVMEMGNVMETMNHFLVILIRISYLVVAFMLSLGREDGWDAKDVGQGTMQTG